MNTNQILQEFFQNNTLMQLATQGDGRLWVCNVYFATDDQFNIYWTSARNRRHSKEIEANPYCAATIVNDPKKKQAVQVSGKAYRVSLADSPDAHQIYGKKLGQKNSRLKDVQGNTPESRAYWVLKPDFIELWDEVNFPEAPKQRVAI